MASTCFSLPCFTAKADALQSFLFFCYFLFFLFFVTAKADALHGFSLEEYYESLLQARAH
jgi:hypothetical protein